MRGLPDPGIPSYGQGFARCAAEAENPGLWQRLVGLWAPSLGPTGSTLFDWSGRKNNGTLTGGPMWVPTDNGWSLNYDGSDDWVICGPNLLRTDTPFSVFAWIRTTDSEWQGTVNKTSAGGADGGDGWMLTKSNAGNTQFRFYEADRDRIIEEYATTLDDGEWHCIGGIYNGSNRIYAYADGKCSAGSAVVGHSPETVNNLQIGKYGNAATLSAHDNVGPVMIWDRVLANGEIQQLYRDSPVLLRPRRRIFSAAAAPAGTILPQMIQQGLYTGAI